MFSFIHSVPSIRPFLHSCFAESGRWMSDIRNSLWHSQPALAGDFPLLLMLPVIKHIADRTNVTILVRCVRGTIAIVDPYFKSGNSVLKLYRSRNIYIYIYIYIPTSIEPNHSALLALPSSAFHSQLETVLSDRLFIPLSLLELVLSVLCIVSCCQSVFLKRASSGIVCRLAFHRRSIGRSQSLVLCPVRYITGDSKAIYLLKPQ